MLMTDCAVLLYMSHFRSRNLPPTAPLSLSTTSADLESSVSTVGVQRHFLSSWREELNISPETWLYRNSFVRPDQHPYVYSSEASFEVLHPKKKSVLCPCVRVCSTNTGFSGERIMYQIRMYHTCRCTINSTAVSLFVYMLVGGDTHDTYVPPK